MCDYLVGGCGSSGSGNVNLPPYKDPSGNYWDISGIISNIPQVLPYTGGFNLYKGVWGNPSRHHFRTLKAGTGISLSYDNPDGGASDETNNSVVITATGGGGSSLFFSLADVNTEDTALSDGQMTYVKNDEVYLTESPASGAIPIWDATNSVWGFITGTENNQVPGWNIAADRWDPIRLSIASLDVDDQSRQDGYVLSWNDAQGIHEYVPQSDGLTTASNGLGVSGSDVRIVGGQSIAVGTLGAVFTTTSVGVGTASLGFAKGSHTVTVGDIQTIINRDGIGYLSMSSGAVELRSSANGVDLELTALGTGANLELTATSGTILLDSVLGKTKIKAPVKTGITVGAPGFGTASHVLGSSATGEVVWVENTDLGGIPDLGEGDTLVSVLGIDDNGNPVKVPSGDIGGSPTFEMSYRFSQGDTEVVDLFIDGFTVYTTLNQNIDTAEISVNGDPFVTLQGGVEVPSGASVVIRITYDLGFNEGVLAVKGGPIIP